MRNKQKPLRRIAMDSPTCPRLQVWQDMWPPFFEASRGSSRSTQLAVAYGESPISWLRGSLQTMCLSARGHGDGDSGEDHH